MDNCLSTNTTKEETPPHKKYQILYVIGTGTFGKVYLAKRLDDQVKVALKNVVQNKKYKNRQLQILLSIQHQNIVRLYEHYYDTKQDVLNSIKKGTFLNLIMEYVPQTLSSIIKENIYSKQFISTQNVKKMSYGLLKALQYLQKKNIAHRDIKPSNILVDQKFQAKLCDFGSAKILVDQQKNISYICSRYYRSPQLILGAIHYTTKVDIWSLGCCMCQMLINRALFQGSNNTSLFVKIIKTIGSPNAEDLKAMQVDKELSEQNIQKVEGIGLRQRVLKINQNADLQIISLIQKMLVYNPEKRIKPSQALKLNLFKNMEKQQKTVE